ncbi:hypothetical protein TYRP_004512 [Tyrophagus putrescentiae]|nr:hypothetical protein TYRP_004512 [Tyrophagus putrescentiae]
MAPYRLAVLTSSDRCSAGLAQDESGPLLESSIVDCGELYSVAEKRTVPDDRLTIEAVLREWCTLRNDIDCVITTGGTGFTARDVTPEATKAVLQKEAPGLVHALMAASLKATPMAALSRLTAGICNRTLIVNFPGSKKACRECFDVLKPLLKHAIDQLREDRGQIDMTHSEQLAVNLPKSKVKLIAVADRHRHSPYEMLSMDDAFAKVLQQVEAYFKQEGGEDLTTVVSAKDLHQYSGYILAEDVFASVPLPPFNASIKDGYAVIAEQGDGIRKLLPKTMATSLAGGSSVARLTGLPEYCVRINTGAAVPEGANAVVQVEDTELVERTEDGEEAVIRLSTVPRVGQDIRPIGSDIAADGKRPLLPRHTPLTAIELGLLASTGVPSVRLYRRPTVAVMSTGDEVVLPGDHRPPHCIWDSNRAVLIRTTASSTWASYPDRVDETFRAVDRALAVADVLISTGGVSMGERDLVKQVLKEDFNATIHFGRVNLKPGKPTTFASCTHTGKSKFIFALPGNPVSCFVTYQVFVKPTLDLLSGKLFALSEDNRSQGLLAMHKTVKCRLRLEKPYKLDPRPEFARAVVSFPRMSTLMATSTAEANPLEYFPTARLTENNQISSRLLNVKDANALILFRSGSESAGQFLEDGTLVDAILL